MVPSLRQSFNKSFTDASYSRLLKRLDALCGMHIDFRVSETPIFIPAQLAGAMVSAGTDIIRQLLSNRDYLSATERAIPAEFHVPGESTHPLFVSVDFGITRDAAGNLQPKLIELQGFPTLYAFQPVLASQYREVYGLPWSARSFLGATTHEQYGALLRSAILADHDPENVVLMEIDPLTQKTRPDFILTERMCGIATVNIRDVRRLGRQLFYEKDGRRLPIKRIYNRAIVDELTSSGVELPFRFSDDLDVEWAGHPNWFFRLSKFALPFLNHPVVPRTTFLSTLDALPDDPARYVLKPLFSFAGAGVIVGPGRKDIDAIPAERRGDYILQERIEYSPVVETPHGGTKAEVRIMYLWDKQLTAVSTLVRMGRGKMMGVSFNKDLHWVGSSAGFVVEEGSSQAT